MTDLEYCAKHPHLDARNPAFGLKTKLPPIGDDEDDCVCDSPFDWWENPLDDEL